MVYAVKQGLQFFNVGFAAAIANTAMLCILVLALALILLVRRADRRASER
jgi:multiple sugar transport system permease protein